MNDIENYILDAIEIMVNKKISELHYNYYIEATVVSLNEDNTCEVEVNDRIYSKVKIREGLELSIGDIVFICIINGNLSNKFIDCKKP
ncbi:hypothetical protein MHB40_15100 [Lysinibacillus sp. FSL K6-0057]|uniref:hypothetical protein n=1 Tax=Lysinibacillus sp. FSL K6-0057 TaxID=2921411 RepID=UPI0031599826